MLNFCSQQSFYAFPSPRWCAIMFQSCYRIIHKNCVQNTKCHAIGASREKEMVELQGGGIKINLQAISLKESQTIKPSFCVCGWVKGGIWRRCRGSPKSCAKGKIWVNEEKWHYRLGHDKAAVQETTGWDGSAILRFCSQATFDFDQPSRLQLWWTFAIL